MCHKEPIKWLADIASNMLDHSDSIVYAFVGISFLLGALFALGFSFWNLWYVADYTAGTH